MLCIHRPFYIDSHTQRCLMAAFSDLADLLRTLLSSSSGVRCLCVVFVVLVLVLCVLSILYVVIIVLELI